MIRTMFHDLLFNLGRNGGPAAVFVAATGLVSVVVLTWLRVRSGMARGPALARSAGDIGIPVAAICIFIIAFWSVPAGPNRELNLIPLIDFFSDQGGTTWWTPVEFGGANMLLFLPLGLFVQLRFRFLSLGTIAGGTAVLATAIEGWQWIFVRGRVTSVDDIIFNTLGAIVGALLVRGIARLYRYLAVLQPTETGE